MFAIVVDCSFLLSFAFFLLGFATITKVCGVTLLEEILNVPCSCTRKIDPLNGVIAVVIGVLLLLILSPSIFLIGSRYFVVLLVRSESDPFIC